jgi:glycosyltransferase involved in cell wall biosynthesis
VRLVLKQYRREISLENFPDVLSLSENVSSGRMAALYALCDCYVSAHHLEGWGLGMAEAMSYGKPVIATGYSGNMEYMTRENSFPVPYVMTHVSRRLCEMIPLFTPDMRWAEADTTSLVTTMRQVAEGRYDRVLHMRAAKITESFGPERISARLAELLSFPSHAS